MLDGDFAGFEFSESMWRSCCFCEGLRVCVGRTSWGMNEFLARLMNTHALREENWKSEGAHTEAVSVHALHKASEKKRKEVKNTNVSNSSQTRKVSGVNLAIFLAGARDRSTRWFLDRIEVTNVQARKKTRLVTTSLAKMEWIKSTWKIQWRWRHTFWDDFSLNQATGSRLEAMNVHKNKKYAQKNNISSRPSLLKSRPHCPTENWQLRFPLSASDTCARSHEWSRFCVFGRAPEDNSTERTF